MAYLTTQGLFLGELMLASFTKYFDSNATLPISDFHKESLIEQLQPFGNASSLHGYGRKAKDMLEACREKCAQFLGVDYREIFFTSGATEANHIAIRGLSQQRIKDGKSVRLFYTQLEHPCVLDAINAVADAEKIELQLDADGPPVLDGVCESLDAGDIFVGMAANNETGHLIDYSSITKLREKSRFDFHSDMVQMPGKCQFDMHGVSTASFSGHKFGAIKGVGFLFKRRGLDFPALFKGSQEKTFRAGTENLTGILSLSIAIDELSEKQSQWQQHSHNLRNHFEERLVSALPWVKIYAADRPRLSNTSNVCFDGIDGESLLFSLDLLGLAVSLGSACSSGSVEPSHVLLGLGYTDKQARSSLRFSFSHHNTLESVDDLVDQIAKTVNRLQRKI